MWEKKFNSPVVALHLYESSSKQLTKINLHILAEPTKNLLENKNEFYQLLRYIKKEPIGLSEESMLVYVVLNSLSLFLLLIVLHAVFVFYMI